MWKMNSKWVAGYLKFYNRSDGRVTGGFNSGGFTQKITEVDVSAQNATLPAATLAAGFLKHTSASAGGTLTVDTGANLDAAFPEWQNGETMSCHYLNDGTQTVTLTGASGVTALSAQTIATLQGRTIIFLKSAASTYLVWAE